MAPTVFQPSPPDILSPQHHFWPFSPLWARGLVLGPLLDTKPPLLFLCLFLASVFPSSHFSLVPATEKLSPLPTPGQPTAGWLPPCRAETLLLAQLLSKRPSHASGQEWGGLQLLRPVGAAPGSLLHRLPGAPPQGPRSPGQAWSWCPQNSAWSAARIELTTYRM